MIKLYKTKFLFVLFLFISIFCSQVLAQQLPQINYQGVARKADGSPVMEQAISLRLSIRDGNATGTSVYSETRQLTTNKFGLFTTVIGSTGTLSQTGNMSAINWSTGNKFLQVELDPQGGSGFVNMGTSQLQSVPYAIYASSAAPGGAAGGDLSGRYPNPVVSKLQGADVSNAVPNTGQVLKWNGTAWFPSDEEGAVGILTANLPITATNSGRNSAVSITQADAATDGYLSKNDWLVFNGKASLTYVDAAISANSSGLAAEITRAIAIEGTKEAFANKSTDVAADGTSDIKYPTVKSIKTYVDANSATGATALAAEISRATTAEGVLTTAAANNATAIGNENTRAVNAEGILTNAIATNITVIATNATAIADETNRATTAEGVLTSSLATNATAITTESTRATTAESLLAAGVAANATTITDENTRATTAEGVLRTAAINNETAIVNEATRATTVEGVLISSVATNATAIAANAVAITIETVRSTTAEGILTTGAANNATAIVNETTRATSADGVLTTAVAANATAITDESTRATTVEGLLAAGVATNAAAVATNATAITDEKTRATIAESVLTTAVAANATATQTALDSKANLASPAFTGTVSGVDKAMVGLGDVDNTTDLLKPVSTATQTALNLKANSVSPTLTGIPLAPTAADGTATTQIANTLFVKAAVDAISTSTSANFVDLITGQTIAGEKIFSADLLVNGVTVGQGATPAVSNTAMGSEALKSNTTGFLNTAVGYKTLLTNTTGARNTAIGVEALNKNNGHDNTSTGYVALHQNATGSFNAGFGSEVLRNNTTGENNTAVGAFSLTSNTLGASNTAVGYQSMRQNTTGGGNTAVGFNSLPSLVTGTYNTALGVQALENSNGTFSNTAIGVAAIDGNTTGSNNAVLGAFAGRYISDGSTSNTVINNSVLIGAETKPNAINESNQIVIGYQAIGKGSNTIQLGNTAITAVNTSGKLTTGTVTYPNTDGTANQVLTTNGAGIASWAAAASGADFSTDITVNGITVGKGTGSSNTTNTVLGLSALTNNTTGQHVLAIGPGALAGNTSADYNLGIGSSALSTNATGTANVAVGTAALANTTGSYNTAVGRSTLLSGQGINASTALGHEAGRTNTGSNNTFLGAQTDQNLASSSVTNATAIGYLAKVTAANQIQLGNTAITAVNTSGDLTAKSFRKSGGTASQYLMADGSVTSGAGIPKTFEALGITLSASYSGSIIYSQNGANPAFPEDLPDGFNCVIINYSNFNFTSNTLSTAKFYTKVTGNTGANTFLIPSGGTVHVNVVTINNAKRYYISGDIN